MTIFTISLLTNGDCRLVQCSASGDVSAPLWLRRSELENYFKGTVLVAGTLEQALKDLGFDAGQVDGRDGPKTQQAVRSFQARATIKIDGIVGDETRAALARALDEAEPSAAGSP